MKECIKPGNVIDDDVKGWSEKDFPNLVKYADPVARVSR